MNRLKQFINNTWVESSSAQHLEYYNPYTEQVLGVVSECSTDDVNRAVQAAVEALPHWRCLSSQARGHYLSCFADFLEAHKSRLVREVVQNNGKRLLEAEMDIDDAISCYRYYAEVSATLEDEQSIHHPSYSITRCYEPLGVVAIITPWNFPLVTSAWKIAPALLAGCTLVFKPSEVVPLPEQSLAQAAIEMGLPEGVFNLVNGGASTGVALTSHPDVNKISFTGSNSTGSAVMRMAAKDVKDLTLELGGKSPILIFPDVSLEAAVEAVVSGICFNAGQMCSATSRLVVHEDIEEALYERLSNVIAQTSLGDPFNQSTDMGPLTHVKQLEQVNRYLSLAKQEGLEGLACNQVAQRPSTGYFVRPHVFRNVPRSSCLWQEEIFGPILCTQSFRNDEEALFIANDHPFALAASVICEDKEKARDIAKRLQAGTVWFNTEQVVLPQTSWGGFKHSGIGRELGPFGLDAYRGVKHVMGPLI